MVERFVSNAGTISIASGESTVTGVGTAFSGRDRAGAQVWAHPDDGAPIRVGTVAEVDPRGIYENLTLPLVTPYNGDDLDGVAYELLDGPAIANGATQAAIYSRFTSFLEQTMGLTGNTADTIDYALVPNNSLFVDAVTRAIYQWRNGVLETVSVVGTSFTPRGAYAGGTTYAKNDLVQDGGYVYVSNANGNVGNTPNTAPASSSYWTWLPLPAGSDAFALSFSITGRPAAGELVAGHVFVDTITVPAGATGSRAKSRVAFAAASTFELWRNGSVVASIAFALGATVGVFTAASEIVFTAGDYADLKCPVARDASGADIRITFKGTR